MAAFNFNSSAETQTWVKTLPPQFKRPCAVLLDGGLGAGKTQVVRWLLEGMGVKGAMSPTFAIHNRYLCASGAIDHVDLYRLKSAADLESSGFWDLLLEPQGLLFVEWAERLSEQAWPAHWQRVHIQLSKDNGNDQARRIEMTVKLPTNQAPTAT